MKLSGVRWCSTSLQFTSDFERPRTLVNIDG
jgi:hypothetical protein